MTARHSRFWLFSFAVVVLLGLGLRIQGLDFGNPAASARPDEELLVKEAIWLLAGDEIRFHNYPPATIHLFAAAFRIAAGLGYLPADPLLGYAVDPLPYHLVARGVGLILGTLTILLVGFTARRLLDPRAATVAAAALAFFPLHALHSHFATVDAPGTFMVAVALHFALRRAEARLGDLLLAAFAAGVAAALKYPMGMVAIVPLLRALAAPRRGRWAASVTVAAALGLLAAAPTLILETEAVLKGLRDEAASQRGRRDQVSLAAIVVQHARLSLAAGFGLLDLALGLAGLAAACLRRQRLALGLVFALLLGAFNLFLGVPFSRYFLPLAPLLALGIAGLSAFGRDRARTLIAVLLLAAQGPNALQSVRTSAMLARLDTRGELLQAFGDGRLPRDLTIVSPEWPFEVFPGADLAILQDLAGREPQDADRRARLTHELARRLPPPGERLRTIPLGDHPDSEATLGGLLQKGPVLYLYPETPAFGADWLGFPFHRDVVLPRLEQAARNGALRLELLLDLDPRRDGRFPAGALFGAFDYWFIPLAEPDAIARPGPRIRVYRVTALL